MPDETSKENSWPDNKPMIGAGEGESPLASPSPSKIDLRTMDSDLKSLNATGNTEPRPYVPPPPISPKQTEMPETGKFSPLGGMPEKIIVGQSPTQSVSTPTPPPAIPADLTKIKKKKKSPFGLIIILVVVVGAIALGYFIFYPNFKGPEELPIPPLSDTMPSDETPSALPSPQSICGDGICDSGEDSSFCPADCEPVAPPADNLPPPSGPATRNSFFKIQADLKQNLIFETFSLASFKEAIVFETVETPIFKEMVLKKNETDFIAFRDFAQTMFPTIFSDTSAFNVDVTVFVYTDSKGTWPGFVARLGAEMNNANVKSDINEKITGGSGSVAGLFLRSPGEPQSWKTGQTSGITNYYLTFTDPNFAVNFGWLGDKLIMSSSYAGFKEAIRRLE